MGWEVAQRLVWRLGRSLGWRGSSREKRADSWDRWRRALKAWLSRLDRVVLATEKRHRRWERAPGAAKPPCSRKPPRSVSHGWASLVSGRLLSPVPPGSEEGQEGDKLVAWPLSHLLLAAFRDY